MLPRGLEVALQQMRKGERAVYRIGAQAGHAAGSAGAAAAAEDGGEVPPPTATAEVKAEWARWAAAMGQDGAVEVELRLERYKIPQDVLGDGCVLK